MRAIDADRLKDNFPNLHKGVEWQIKDGYFSPQYVALMIDEAPTIGVAAVTRCVECKHMEGGWCRLMARSVKNDFFCGDAVERGQT